MKNIIVNAAIIVLGIAIAYIMYSLYTQNNELRRLGECEIVGVYTASTPVMDEYRFVDQNRHEFKGVY